MSATDIKSVVNQKYGEAALRVTLSKMKTSDSLEILFKPTRIGGVDLHNRIAMAPMTRSMSPGGVPGENVARYYRRRAEGGVGLIITEGTVIPHPSAGHDENAPRIYGAHP